MSNFSQRLRHYGPLNGYDLLKAAALLLMVVDHVGAYILPQLVELRWLGRFAMPIFLFLVGYSGVYRFRWGLLVWAAIVTGWAVWHHHALLPLNILWAILLARLVMQWMVHKKWLDHPQPGQLVAVFASCVIWYLPLLFIIDYGAANILFAVLGYMAAQRPGARSTVYFALATGLFHGVTQALDHGFSAGYSAALVVGLCLLCWAMAYGKPQVDGWRLLLLPARGPIKRGAMHVALVVSRYSLEFYALHLMLLYWLATYLRPESYQGFTWIIW